MSFPDPLGKCRDNPPFFPFYALNVIGELLAGMPLHCDFRREVSHDSSVGIDTALHTGRLRDLVSNAGQGKRLDRL